MATEAAEQKVDELEQEDGLQEEKKETPPTAKTKTETDELKSALTELTGIVKAQAEPKKEEEKELTQEQKNELWAVYDPEATRADFMRKFFRMNEDATPEQVAEAKELFGDMQKGLVKQSIVGARHFLAIEAQKLRDEFKDALDFVSEAKAEKVRKNFYDTYPALDDPKYAKIVTATAKTLSEKDYKSQSEYFKALADGAADTIKGVLPEFDLGAEKQETKKSTGTPPRLPRTSVGGQGGAGSGSGASTPKSTPKGGDIAELDDD